MNIIRVSLPIRVPSPPLGGDILSCHSRPFHLGHHGGHIPLQPSQRLYCTLKFTFYTLLPLQWPDALKFHILYLGATRKLLAPLAEHLIVASQALA